jgi:DNA-binding IclR family transcriptional regulator
MDDAPDQDAPQDRQFVIALARGLEILRCFKPGDQMLGNQEMAARTGLPKPTVSRLTHTLTRLGYLVYVERFAKYRLGTAVLSLGYSALSAMDIRQVARPMMQELADYSDVAVALSSYDRTSMVYVEICRGQGALTIQLAMGSRIPVTATAMGRAYLAALSDSERNAILAEVRAKRPAAEWPAIQAGVDQAVRDYQERGFTLSVGEWKGDIHAVGVPVRQASTGAIYALNCGGAGFLLPRERLETDLGPRLVQLARRIEAAVA